MSEAATKKNGAILRDVLRLERFEGLAGELKPWRKSDDLKVIQSAKGSALVLPFVKGLRLSAQLIYILRTRLSHTNLEVDWGHLLNDEEVSCSPECDVIIHHRGCWQEWNGSEHGVMHFRFVESKHAVAVVSCKSFAKKIDPEYAKKLRPYVKDVFLFAECCAPKQIGSLRSKAAAAGYAGFWYLYTYDEATGECENDPRSWRAFLTAVEAKVGKALKKAARRRAGR
jgi:hypothetical protein